METLSLSKVLGLLKVDTSDTDLTRAHIAAFSKQVPLLYFILAVNAGALAISHHHLAPPVLSTYLPGTLILVCVIRLCVWALAGRVAIADADAVHMMKNMLLIGCGIGVLFLSWAISLYSYGNNSTHAHVTFFVAITAICCMFCLMHVRAAALALTLTIIIPFVLFLVSRGTRSEAAIAVNLLLVAGLVIYLVFISSRDFEQMIRGQREMRRLNDENARIANIDSLTELPNRRRFFQELRTLAQTPANSRLFAVGVIDLDGFKPINDLYGHSAGDGVLREMGDRLRAISTSKAFLARLGGDEFGIILRNVHDESDLLAFGDRLCEVLRLPIRLPGLMANVAGSIGFAMSPASGAIAEVLYEQADYALYFAKTNKRGRTVVFSAAHETEIRKSGLIEQALRKADLDTEMELHFQPLFDIVLNRAVGFEALARWNSPELGSVSPGLFIPVAERSDLINALTRTLLRKALAAAHHWPDDIKISFNLSMRDLISEEAILQIITIIENSGIPPHRIDLEVTETSLMGDFERVRTSIQALKALGVNISLDDFGTGYSSLSYVHRLPLDKIKIDRSFVEDIDTGGTSRDIIQTVIALCSSLKIQCVVEGMETADQARILRDLGCRTMQGYFFAKPMKTADVSGYLQTSSTVDWQLPAVASA